MHAVFMIIRFFEHFFNVRVDEQNLSYDENNAFPPLSHAMPLCVNTKEMVGIEFHCVLFWTNSSNIYYGLYIGLGITLDKL